MLRKRILDDHLNLEVYSMQKRAHQVGIIIYVCALIVTATACSLTTRFSNSTETPTPTVEYVYKYETPEEYREEVLQADADIAEFLSKHIDNRADYTVAVISEFRYKGELIPQSELDPTEIIYTRKRDFKITASHADQRVKIEFFQDQMTSEKRRYYTELLEEHETSSIETTDQTSIYRTSMTDLVYHIVFDEDSVSLYANNALDSAIISNNPEIINAMKNLFFPENLSIYEGEPRSASILERQDSYQVMYWKEQSFDELQRPFLLLLDKVPVPVDLSLFTYNYIKDLKNPNGSLETNISDKSCFFSQVYPLLIGEELISEYEGAPYDSERINLSFVFRTVEQ